MKGPIYAALGLAVAAGLGGCGSTPSNPQEYAMQAAQKQHEAQVQAIKDVVEQSPSWYATPPNESGYLYSAGTATSGDMQFAIDKASLNAKRAIADQVRGKLSADLKDYIEESGGSIQPVAAMQGQRTVHDVVSEVVLQGYEVTQRKVVAAGTGYRAYVLIRYPVVAAAAPMASNDPKPEQRDLSANLRASKAFQDLEQEIHDAQAREHGLEPAPLGESAAPAESEPPAPSAVPEPPVASTPEQ